MNIKEYILYNLEYIGYYFVGFGLIFSGLYYASEFNNSEGWGAILISLGVFTIALGISRKSSTTTKGIAYSSFKETYGEFEDRRLALREKNQKIDFKRQNFDNYSNSTDERIDILDLNIYLSYSIWKCFTYLDRAMIYRKQMRDNDENDLIHQVDCFFQDLCEGLVVSHIALTNEYQNHLEKMYNIISKFNRFNKDTIKEQFRKERILGNLKFLKRIDNKIFFFDKCTIITNYLQ